MNPPGAALPMHPASPDTPLRALLRQAWWIAVLYLLAGGFVALMRRLTHRMFWNEVAEVFDSVGIAALRLLHLWSPIGRALFSHRLDNWEVRLLLIAVTVGIIFLQALALGLVLTAVRALWLRLGAPREG